MPADLGVEHRYPDALGFLQQHGPEALAVLHDLLIHARRLDGELVVEASVRQVADRLRFVSKDTVHRRLRQLLSAGVLRRLHHEEVERFTRRVYAIDLTGTGVSVHRTHARP